MKGLKSLLRKINEAIAIDSNDNLYVKDDSDMSDPDFLDDVVLKRSGIKGSKITSSKIKIDTNVKGNTIYFDLDSAGNLTLKEEDLSRADVHVRVYSSYKPVSHETTGDAFDRVHTGKNLKGGHAPNTTKYIAQIILEALSTLLRSQNEQHRELAQFFIFLYFGIYRKGKLIKARQYKPNNPSAMLNIIASNVSVNTLMKVYRLVTNTAFTSSYRPALRSVFGDNTDYMLALPHVKWDNSASRSVRANNKATVAEIKQLKLILDKFGKVDMSVALYNDRKMHLERMDSFNIFRQIPSQLVKNLRSIHKPLKQGFLRKTKLTPEGDTVTVLSPDLEILRDLLIRANADVVAGNQLKFTTDEAIHCINMLHSGVSSTFSSDVKSVALDIAKMAKNPTGSIGNKIKSSQKFAIDIINETLEGLKSKISAYGPEIIIVPESSSDFNRDFKNALTAMDFIEKDVEIVTASKFTRFSDFRMSDAEDDKKTAISHLSQKKQNQQLQVFLSWLKNDWYANTYIKKLYELYSSGNFPDQSSWKRGANIKIHDVTPGGMMSYLRKYFDGFLRVIKSDPHELLEPGENLDDALEPGERFVGENDLRYQVESLFHQMMTQVTVKLGAWLATLNRKALMPEKRQKIRDEYDAIMPQYKAQFETLLSDYLYENYKSPQIRAAPAYPDTDVDEHEDRKYDVYLDPELDLYIKIDDEFVYKENKRMPPRKSGQAVKQNILQAMIATLENEITSKYGNLKFENNLNNVDDFLKVTVTSGDYKEYVMHSKKLSGSRVLAEIFYKYGYEEPELVTKAGDKFTAAPDFAKEHMKEVEYQEIVKTTGKDSARYDVIMQTTRTVTDKMFEFAKKDMLTDLPHLEDDFYKETHNTANILKSAMALIAQKAFSHIDGRQTAKKRALSELNKYITKIKVDSGNRILITNFINYLNKVPFLHDLEYGKPRIKKILIIDDNVATGGTISIVTRDILKKVAELEGMGDHKHECYTQHSSGESESHYMLKNILVITPFSI